METLLIKQILYDPDLQQRAVKIDPIHLKHLVDALQTGAVFPPIVVDKASRRVVDGIHRYHAVKKFAGDDAPIPCELREFADENEIFLFIVSSNATHGLPWSQIDRDRITLEAERRGVSYELLSTAMKTPIERIERVLATAIVRPGLSMTKELEKAPLKSTMPAALRGKELTREQDALNERMGGMKIGYYVGLVVDWIDADMLKYTSTETLFKFQQLRRVLNEKLG